MHVASLLGPIGQTPLLLHLPTLIRMYDHSTCDEWCQICCNLELVQRAGSMCLCQSTLHRFWRRRGPLAAWLSCSSRGQAGAKGRSPAPQLGSAPCIQPRGHVPIEFAYCHLASLTSYLRAASPAVAMATSLTSLSAPLATCRVRASPSSVPASRFDTGHRCHAAMTQRAMGRAAPPPAGFGRVGTGVSTLRPLNGARSRYEG